MAAHQSPRTTLRYGRTKERLTQDEVERIRLRCGRRREAVAIFCEALKETSDF
jgi:hypothetical protein